MRTNERASLELDGPCSDQGRLPSPASDGAQHSHSTTAVDSEATANGRGTVDAALAEVACCRQSCLSTKCFLTVHSATHTVHAVLAWASPGAAVGLRQQR